MTDPGSVVGANVINDRISRDEKLLGSLFSEISYMATRSAKIRDNGDAINKAMSDYVSTEQVSVSLRETMMEGLRNLVQLQDYRNAEVVRLQARVAKPLENFGDAFKNVKAHIKSMQSTNAKLAKQQKKGGSPTRSLMSRAQSLDNVNASNNSGLQRSNSSQSLNAPGNTALSSTLRSLGSASLPPEALAANAALREELIALEAKKLEELKAFGMGWAQVEMAFHARSLELFSRIWSAYNGMDCAADLENFKRVVLQLAPNGPPSGPLQQRAVLQYPPNGPPSGPLQQRPPPDPRQQQQLRGPNAPLAGAFPAGPGNRPPGPPGPPGPPANRVPAGLSLQQAGAEDDEDEELDDEDDEELEEEDLEDMGPAPPPPGAQPKQQQQQQQQQRPAPPVLTRAAAPVPAPAAARQAPPVAGASTSSAASRTTAPATKASAARPQQGAPAKAKASEEIEVTENSSDWDDTDTLAEGDVAGAPKTNAVRGAQPAGGGGPSAISASAARPRQNVRFAP